VALGQVDVLVNNAGVGIGGTQWRVGDRDEGRELFETNFWSPLALTAALVPGMRERDHGAVVNVSSVSQVAPWPLMGHYSSSKAAIGSASETLRLELANSRVHVLEVVAGPNDTAVQAEAQELPGFADAIRGGGMGRPERLAALVVRALERERPRIVYPRRAGVGYWFPPLLRAVLPRMARRVPEAADDPRVVRGGSQGDAESLEARAEWERAHRG
jgi:short-subunit dehydrogenase